MKLAYETIALWSNLRNIKIFPKGEKDEKHSFLVQVILWISILLFASSIGTVAFEAPDILSNALAGTSLLGFISVGILTSYYKYPIKNDRSFLLIKYIGIVYDAFLVFSTLCFIRLTILLPALLSNSNADIAEFDSKNDYFFGLTNLKQLLIFSPSYLYSFTGISIFLFLFLRIPLNYYKKQFSAENKKLYNKQKGNSDTPCELFLDNSINKWNYVLATWFGLFTVFSTVAILGMG